MAEKWEAFRIFIPESQPHLNPTAVPNYSSEAILLFEDISHPRV